MHADPTDPQTDLEGLVAALTEAAYGFALRHGFKGTFVEVELGLWHALRASQGRIEEFASASPPTGPTEGGRNSVGRSSWTGQRSPNGPLGGPSGDRDGE